MQWKYLREFTWEGICPEYRHCQKCTEFTECTECTEGTECRYSLDVFNSHVEINSINITSRVPSSQELATELLNQTYHFLPSFRTCIESCDERWHWRWGSASSRSRDSYRRLAAWTHDTYMSFLWVELVSVEDGETYRWHLRTTMIVNIT